MAVRTHYDTLQVSETASPEVIRGAYKYLSQKWHPDKNPANRAESERVMRMLNLAFAVLSDPQKRRDHDEWIREERSQHVKQAAVLHVDPPAAETNPRPELKQPGFVGRVWLMLLFAASAVMLGGVFPYQLLMGRFEWPYIAGLLLWLGVGRYSYVSLFHPEIVSAERAAETEQRSVQRKPRQIAQKLGWLTGIFGGGLITAGYLVSGAESEFAVIFGILMAPIIGLLTWVITALIRPRA